MCAVRGKSLLITEGTGSLGKRFVRTALERLELKRLVVFSRDELKQFEVAQRISAPNLRHFIDDVRAKERLHRALDGIDVVVHAAALKQVPAPEYNPFEAVKTNVIGPENVINEAIGQGVERVLALSTDKAANPINLYGATKLCSDKLFVPGNAYAGARKSQFAVVWYGRFWISVEQGVEFVTSGIERMHAGEIFVPKISSMNIMDLAKAVAPECKTEITGIRPGEKLHEVMVPEDDARNTAELDDRYLIKPTFQLFDHDPYEGLPICPEGFRSASDTNTRWPKEHDLAKMVAEIKLDEG